MNVNISENNEKIAEKIIIVYDDGIAESIEKGVCVSFCPAEGGQMEICAEMVGISGPELKTVINAFIQLGGRLGMFRDDPEEAEDE